MNIDSRRISAGAATFIAALIAAGPLAAPLLAQAEDEIAQAGKSDTELAKTSQNPVGDLISLPLQNNTTFGVGPNDATDNTLNIQPIYPVKLGTSLNLINRFILPVKYQGEVVQGAGSEFGLGDLTWTGFMSPQSPGKIILGAGPVLILPTATDDRLGSGKWQAGAGVLALTIRGPWVIGVLAQNTWSFAGDSDRSDVSFLFSQYFVNYNFDAGWYLSSSPIITANWKADSGQKWTVPFGGGPGKVFRLGKLPVDGTAHLYYNAIKPDFQGRWTLRVQFKMLFPK